MKIIPLSKTTLDATIALTNSVFVREGKKKWPEIAYKGSLGYTKESDILSRHGTSFARYWVASDQDKILGTIGLYAGKYDGRPHSLWLGWFCVDPEQRGKGLGRKLLEFAVEKAKKIGYKELWLYTSRDPNEAVAQILYEKVGFELVEQEVAKPYTILYRKKSLSAKDLIYVVD